MNILWHSTAPFSPSSYSVLTNRTIPPIVRAGHNVTLSQWYGLQGQPLPWAIMSDDNKEQVGTVTMLPHTGANDYGGGMLRDNYEFTKADVLITCSDVWVFGNKTTAGLNFAPWLPVDHDPVPAAILDSLKTATYPMCYSKWGTELLLAAGIKAHYVPCSASTKTYSPGDKKLARQKFKVDKEYEFLVTMVAANKDPGDRKGFSEALRGFAKFAGRHPGAILYVHTNWSGPIHIGNMAKSLGIENIVVQPDQYGYNLGMIDETYMANVYRASDVLLNPAKSEGFGLPLIEAQMCGCPIIATDFATTDELLFAGWKVAGQLDWSMGAESWRKRVYVDAVADALEQAYQERDNKKLRTNAINGAQAYDNKTVFNRYWLPALSEIGKLI